MEEQALVHIVSILPYTDLHTFTTDLIGIYTVLNTDVK